MSEKKCYQDEKINFRRKERLFIPADWSEGITSKIRRLNCGVHRTLVILL
ncbi:hypothetical protein AVEN_257940-1, partial [Araneus ventricosus]